MINPFLTEPDRVFDALSKIENHSDIARLAGVHPSTITKMATGQKRNPTIGVMARIYKALCDKGLMDTSIIKKTECTPVLETNAGVTQGVVSPRCPEISSLSCSASESGTPISSDERSGYGVGRW